jgi:TRAP-type C4-dicarboxylate transport system substrate-binding protein
MNPDQRARARERFQTWRALPEERRELIRRRWEQFQRLDPQSQARVRENFRAFAQLPPEKRRMLRRRWLEATPEQRAHMRERLEARRERRRELH